MAGREKEFDTSPANVASDDGGVIDGAELVELRAKVERAEKMLAAADALCETVQASMRALAAERDAALVRAAQGASVLSEAMAKAEAAEQALADSQGGGVDRYARLGEEVAEVLRSAADRSDSMRAEAERWAEKVRGEADQYVIRLRNEAEDYQNRLRQEADRALLDAKRQSAEVSTRAERYAQETRSQADQHVENVKASAQAWATATRGKAEEEAGVRLQAAQADAAAVLASAREELERLQTTKRQLRAGLEAASAWVLRSLDSPAEELSPPTQLNGSEKARPVEPTS